MKEILRKYLFLFLSFLCFFVSSICWYFFVYSSSSSTSDKSFENIKTNIHQELNKISEESDEVKKVILLNNRLSFNELRKTHYSYPYFIFKNRELSIWSTNSFAPSYESLRGNQKFRFLQLKNGKYIIYKQSLLFNNDFIEIFVFLPLTHEYAIHNNYIQSGLNEDVFGTFPFKVTTNISKQGYNIISNTGDFLFSIEVPENHNYHNEFQMLLLVLMIGLGIVFLVMYLYKCVQGLRSRNKIGWAIIWLGIGLCVIRGLMLLVNYPFSIYEYNLFNSRYFASSALSPSLGDMLLNIISAVIFSWFLFKNFHGTKLYRRLVRAQGDWKMIISIALAALSFYTLYLVFYFLGILSYHSQWSLDITSDIDFDLFRINSLIVFVAVFILYFIYSHIIFRILISLNAHVFSKVAKSFLLGALCYIVFSFLFTETLWVIIVVNFVYFLILYLMNLPRTVGSIKYSTYMYFLTCAMVCSITGSYTIYRKQFTETNFDKQHYANDLLFKNDVFGEFLLNEASAKIRHDEFIQSRLLTPLTSKDLIEYKIKRVFLSNYFDKYNVTISVFDYYGNGYEKASQYSNYIEAEQKYKLKKYTTEFQDIYFVIDPETGSKKYVSFNEIYFSDILIGYVVIELTQKKIVANSVYPELLVNNFSEKPIEQQTYNHAVYSHERLLYSYGNFSYASLFDPSWLSDIDLYQEGFVSEGYHHIGIVTGEGKIIVVSSEAYSFKRMFSNFSFLFLLLIIVTLIYIVFYAINKRTISSNTTYATKIQVYLNIAFFLPLLIVSITTLSIISASYKDNLNNSFLKKAEYIASNISNLINGFKKEGQRERMEAVLSQIAKYTESDINIYNNKGRLIYTNQPLILDLGLSSRLIHPKAYANMIEYSSNTQMIQERVGKLKYNAAYVSIRSTETNHLIAILSIPFFESKNELDKQIIHVLTTIVNIFVSIFLLFLILSYFASHILTVPLKIITQKLRRTTLEKNEPIEWRSKDEIGLLIGEYNTMLVKLDESRTALSKNEKESAWREMAKQVAHEIKNPLTPMKLTIQHLQRSLDKNDESLPEKTNKALNVLLDQVNNLSEIATSFSLFAKMPIPKTHRFDIASVLVKVLALHNNSNGVNVESDIESGQFFVEGDEQLINGIFTNLILNGIQSVPSDREAHIMAKLTKKGENVLIEIKDNGSGIPESIREKVFLPNFSTKFSGSGIGLAVAKRGVEHAGGRIWFETIQEKGTSFYIEIPIVE